ncbi:histidine-type phosphatase [Azorhizobium doebereinerae]|uniref:histidine-type phosphatase n=1 Tax=Azorhizobium doebereinerae TaxID=281091 RepID=UPI0004208F26|nr:histidine-type phosphatase [Azorhizobium doebereinerae]
MALSARVFPPIPGSRARLLLAALAALLLGAGPAAAEMVLERVVLVERHGVRAPIQSPETLAAWSPRLWPAWPVARGILTPHGREVVGLVADGIRARYVATGLLLAQGCPGDGLVVWADSKDQRTRESGQMMADRLAPGCGVKAGFAPARDLIFNSLAGACRLDRKAGAAAVAVALAPSGALVDPASAEAIRRAGDILRPGAPPAPVPSAVAVKKTGINIAGPLAVTADAAEVFLLQYAQGMPVSDVAWGAAADPATLGVLLAARTRTTDMTRRLSYLAVRRGSAMARLMLATLAGETRPAAPAVGQGVKLLALAGHDTNLSNMAGVFGVDWTLPGQPDATAPATAFALERWRDSASGALSVGLTVWYGELEGLRTLDPAKVHGVKVPLPGCGDSGMCPLETLRRRVLDGIPAACAG